MQIRSISGWRGIALIAITYIYFLIFAQFAFLKRLAALGITDDHLKAVMGAMACGGILFSLSAPRITLCPSPGLRLRVGLTACGLAAALSVLPLGLAASVAVSGLIGCGLGLLTVTLVTNLRRWLGTGNPLLQVALGTGLGYLVCNIPPFFTASPETQAALSAILCFTAFCLTLGSVESEVPEAPEHTIPAVPFIRVLASFTALIWLDSAAFFIIQNTPALKSGTWEGSIHLAANGLLHFAAAVAAAWLLRRRGLSFVLSLAFLELACACLLLLNPSRALIASVFYPVGVSLYSVALVAYPSLIAPAASASERGRQAGWIYAIAGWFGSAMGIGMGQNLGYVPPAFVLAAGLVILLPELWRRRKRETVAVAAVLAMSLAIDRATLAPHPGSSETAPAAYGRQVYISEGCISCHSQYVRPHTQDTLLWGPVQSAEEIERQHPPLIGNRRQGPDLAQVGRRRSTLWLKAHLYDPAEVSHASFMPSYAYLFQDRRGDSLVSYLQSLRNAGDESQLRAEYEWKPSGAPASNPEHLFRLYCATCHTPTGLTVQRWLSNFKRRPPNLQAGPFLHLPKSDSPADRKARVARIIKFGIPGTDMPGHEYLPDDQIAAISLWVAGDTRLDPIRGAVRQTATVPPQPRPTSRVLSLCNGT
jgi:mono/diheme cytochrome c family protein